MEGKRQSFVNYVRPYVSSWLTRLDSEFLGQKNIRVLDLGAGSCTISLFVSERPYVSEVVAADISSKRMQQILPDTHALVGGNLNKLSFQEIDFNELLPFKNNSFEVVVMDASLHHSRNIWVTLSEIRRVLAPGGIFVAQREAYTSPLTHWITFRRLLASPEVAAGVSENAYLVSQYDYYLRANGFIPEFLPVYETWTFKLLFFLNGIAFSKYNIIARSTKL
jgi:ubiquinone/menaquinone biosynthesis C-methylase UbiE